MTRLPHCPHCLSSALSASPVGVLDCAACLSRLLPPAAHLTRPAWSDDPRLGSGAWDRYGRPGLLVAYWGTSTQREDGRAPRGDGEEAKEPRVLAAAERGAVDDELDRAIAGAVDETERTADVLRAVAREARRPAPRRPAPRATKHLTARAILLEHVGAAPSGPLPALYLAAAEAIPAAIQGCIHGLAELLANALLGRGVDVWALLGAAADSLDAVAPRLPRTTPLAGYGHALSLLFGDAPTLGGRSPVPSGVSARHPLPGGVVFGQQSVHPSRSGGSGDGGLDAVLDRVDVQAAVDSVRMFRRTESRGGAAVEIDPGRGLDGVELEMLRLADYGHTRAKATRSKKGVVTPAVEALGAKGAARLAAGGDLTEKQAGQRLKRAKRGLEDALRERGLIPAARPRPARAPREAAPVDPANPAQAMQFPRYS